VSQVIDDNALYVVATPIGNLGDMVPRAVEILHAVDLIAAEDTRHSARLMQHFGINTRLVAYHDHSDDAKVDNLIGRLLHGESVALISDAGTPLVSDPGYRLVKAAREAGIKVVPVPGACALVAALSASGLPSNRFAFEGFPPAKAAARVKFFQALSHDERTLIFYESPHRILDSLKAMAEVFGDTRNLVLARELTKTFETFLSGSVADVLEQVRQDANQQRGEIVLLVQGYTPPEGEEGLAPEVERVLAVLLEELPVKQAAALAARLTGEKKNALYKWALEFTGRNA
jgi:16S rRNA (cytidine1402-2'-O)-methyltransferase